MATFNFYYHADAWANAFMGSAAKIVITKSGSVFSESIAIENLVVDSSGNPGVLGLPPKNEIAIFTNRNDGSAYAGAVHFMLADKDISSGQVNLSSGEVKWNSWRHIVAVVDNINKVCQIWLDGEKIAEAAYTGNTTMFSSIRQAIIGRHGYTALDGYDYEGRIDDFRIYPRALTAEEIGDIYAWGNQKQEYEERVWVPPAGHHKGKTAKIRLSSPDYLSVRTLAVDYRREEIR